MDRQRRRSSVKEENTVYPTSSCPSVEMSQAAGGSWFTFLMISDLSMKHKCWLTDRCVDLVVWP